MALELEVEEQSGCAVVRAAGELDTAEAPALSDAIAEAFTAGHRRVLVELSQVSFIDSTGTTALLREHRAADERGERLDLVAPSDQITRVFHMLGVDDLVHLHASLEEALGEG
jgi:anti-sigma B factor antagonist